MPIATTIHAARQQPEQLAFNASTIAAISSSVITSKAGFSRSEKRTAARAILRHNMHIDNDPGTRNARLHPWYINLHGKGNAKGVEMEEIKIITNETFRDFLDTVSYFYYPIQIINLPEPGLCFGCHRWWDIPSFTLPRLSAKDHQRA